MQITKRSLEFFPVQLFAVVMGFSGFVIAIAKAYHLIDMPYIVYETLLFIDTALFFTIFILYMIKLFLYPHAVKKEFYHPVKSAFMATISISFLLVSIAYYDYAPTISILFWYIGAPLQLIFTFVVLRYWIINQFDIIHSNPAWFIPIVGNLLVPVVGVDAAPLYVSVFFFSIGLFFWLVLFTIMLYRIIFHHPLAKKLVPTFFIFIAPPAVAFISYFRITNGSIDMMSLFLYSIAFFTFVLLLLLMKIYDTKEFFISWWAYTFPLAAMTIATLLMYMTYHNTLFYGLSICIILVTAGIIAFVMQRTLKECMAGNICVEEI